MDDNLIYKCDLCIKKFSTLEELRAHKTLEHSNNIYQDNYIPSIIISPNNGNNDISLNSTVSKPGIGSLSENINEKPLTTASEIENSFKLESKESNSDTDKIILNEKQIPSAPLLSSDMKVITEQPQRVYTDHNEQQRPRQEQVVCCGDPCICCCQPTIRCDDCICINTHDTVDSATASDGNCKCHCCPCDCDGCGDCNCRDCDCGDCDCGDCDCGDCDCESCDCGGCDCVIM